jgi:hypothetical protein
MAIALIALLAGLGTAPPEEPPPLVRIAPAAPVTEKATAEDRLLQRLMEGSATDKAAAAAEIEKHPDEVNPFALIILVTYLFEQGDRARGSFWFYFWQQRSRPWARLGSPDGERALRASFNATVGPMVNEWAGSDPIAMRELMARAWRYERRVPLYPGRPPGVGEKEWADAVAKERAVNDPEELVRLFPGTPADLAQNAAARRSNGLYVGPWQHPGRALPEEWH